MSYQNDLSHIVARLKTLNILIIETDAEERENLQSILSEYRIGRVVIEADCGRALERLHYGERPQLILVDEVCGPEFCRMARRLTPCPLVVVVSSQGIANSFKMLEAGAGAIVKKPYQEKELLRSIWQSVDVEILRERYSLHQYCSLKKDAIRQLS